MSHGRTFLDTHIFGSEAKKVSSSWLSLKRIIGVEKMAERMEEDFTKVLLHYLKSVHKRRKVSVFEMNIFCKD